MDLGGKVGKEKRRHDDRKCAILEEEIKGRCHVLVFSFTGLLFLFFLFFFKKKIIKSESLKKPKTPTGDGQRELRTGHLRGVWRMASGWGGDEGKPRREMAGMREGAGGGGG